MSLCNSAINSVYLIQRRDEHFDSISEFQMHMDYYLYVHASILMNLISILMNLISILMNLMDSLEFVPLYLQGPCFFQIGNNLIIDFTKKNQYGTSKSC